MYDQPYPTARPTGLRSRSIAEGTEWWRIDRTDPLAWRWVGHAVPRHRFDGASGDFRTRYAARTIAGAARERYLSTGLLIPHDHAEHHLIHLRATRRLRILDLRTEANLHALDADDRLSTGHETHVWDACHRLADAARQWWPDLDGIAYRSRTSPESSFNLAFFADDGFATTARPLRSCAAKLDDLVLHHHFTMDFDY